MKTQIRNFTLALLLAIAAPMSFAATVDFGAILSGAAEVPVPVATLGSGEGFLVFDDVTSELAWLISFNDLSGAAGGAHIHAVAPGTADPTMATGGVEIDLDASAFISGLGKTAGIFSGAATLDMAQIDQLFAGELYINIHTGSFPGGEIRGQIFSASVAVAPVPLPMAVWFLISGLSGVLMIGRKRSRAA